ncbi:hypothetical protein BpHYR1_001068 [Brachionus plicatilis]|uniref:Uncharacterized protein n=1 Tax=Brachionus plicatilis TaxID=10195 RepID=A0A3M7RRC8_BRAPC|nr:hypothetical protein BpHYR1_001068 [Brachionus plicatilis]
MNIFSLTLKNIHESYSYFYAEKKIMLKKLKKSHFDLLVLLVKSKLIKFKIVRTKWHICKWQINSIFVYRYKINLNSVADKELSCTNRWKRYYNVDFWISNALVCKEDFKRKERCFHCII